jgi:hypothetical protein
VNKPIRIKLSRAKGWRKPANTVTVSRPSKWGNPFPLKDPSPQARRQLIARYTKWIGNSKAGLALRVAAETELRGKNLACWCPLDQPCHADVLLAIANAEIRKR